MSEQNDSLADTIKPKSDQLNADDLLTGPITVKIMNVTRGDGEQPISVAIDGGRQPFRPCKSMRRVMIALWGDKGKDWIGKRMTLYADMDVAFGGVKVGGIRISHASGITDRVKLMLTTTRSKRKEFVIDPIVDDVIWYPVAKFDTGFSAIKSAIESGKMTIDGVIAQCEKTGKLSQAQIDRIRACDNGADVQVVL